MNPQLSMMIASSRQQDLQAAAAHSARSADLSTGTSVTARLREAVAHLRRPAAASAPAPTRAAITGA